jgi:hypothetical protein
MLTKRPCVLLWIDSDKVSVYSLHCKCISEPEAVYSTCLNVLIQKLYCKYKTCLFRQNVTAKKYVCMFNCAGGLVFTSTINVNICILWTAGVCVTLWLPCCMISLKDWFEFSSDEMCFASTNECL